MTTIREMQEQAHATSRGKGWWDEKIALSLPEGTLITDAHRKERIDPRRLTHDDIAVKLALIHSEVSEALEAVRSGDGNDLYGYTSGLGKPEGLPSELADVFIRIGDLCGAMGIDLQEWVDAKMAYNLTRPHRHGGKTL